LAADCSSSPTGFSNPTALTLEPANDKVAGFLYADLTDKTVAAIYEFCLKITTTYSNLFKLIPNLKFVIGFTYTFIQDGHPSDWET